MSQPQIQPHRRDQLLAGPRASSAVLKRLSRLLISLFLEVANAQSSALPQQTVDRFLKSSQKRFPFIGRQIEQLLVLERNRSSILPHSVWRRTGLIANGRRRAHQLGIALHNSRLDYTQLIRPPSFDSRVDCVRNDASQHWQRLTAKLDSLYGVRSCIVQSSKNGTRPTV